ncbi:ArsA family ATPase [Serinicoccus sp. CUA-874]|uniref:ArsA family ATPase n=1 Tax=Serinicoccus sp. CUA-874 TaxID=1517939 RepID=UPI002AA29E81|nr:ArsA-related P-loop ATPase [Serinicoccus sp. CUA-874]
MDRRLVRRQQRSARFGEALRGLQSRGSRDAGDRAAADVVGSSAPVDRRGRRDAEIRRILDRRQSRFTALRTLLQDDTRSSFVIVLAAERLPVLESVDLHGQLARAGMAVGALVVNKRSPADAGPLLADRREVEQRYVDQVRSELPGLPLVEVPLLPGELVGEQALLRVARDLG